MQEEHKTQVVDSFFIDWVSNESKAETILKIKDAFRNREHTYGDNFICELIQYQSSKTSKVALSGVLHGGADHGFFLVTAFLLT